MTIRDLLDHTYGPYPDFDLLSNDFASNPKFIPALTSVYMCTENDGTPIGLNETACWVGPTPINHRAAQNVRFFGVLTIKSLSWLSDTGKAWLEKDIRNKDEEIHVYSSSSKITLEGIYGNALPGTGHFHIKVYICCIQTLRAQFLTSEASATDLLIFSEDQNRQYRIQSLHPRTYDDSQDFLDRWRLWQVIAKLVKIDGGRTPLSDRTVQWVVERYFQYFLEEDRHRRIIFVAEGETGGPRMTRHIPRNEILGRIAEHAEWLLAYQLAPSHKNRWMLDIQKFVEFCQTLPKRRKEARIHGLGFWGIPRGDCRRDSYENADLCVRLCLFGETYEYWLKKLATIHTQRKKPAPAHKQKDPISPPVNRNTITTFHYDSDFSEASTSAASDDESENNDKLQNKIPSFCWLRPEIPVGQFAWHCPGCKESIDLLHLTPDHIGNLPPNIANNLSRKLWSSVDDPMVQNALFLLIDKHYIWHIEQLGLKIQHKPGGGWTVQTYRSQKPPRAAAPPERTPKVKTEHREHSLTDPRRSARQRRPPRPRDL